MRLLASSGGSGADRSTCRVADQRISPRLFSVLQGGLVPSSHDCRAPLTHCSLHDSLAVANSAHMHTAHTPMPYVRVIKGQTKHLAQNSACGLKVLHGVPHASTELLCRSTICPRRRAAVQKPGTRTSATERATCRKTSLPHWDPSLCRTSLSRCSNKSA